MKFGLAAAVMQGLLMEPLSALSAVVMVYILGSLTSARAALFLSLLYAFATPVFYRTAQLNQNLLVSHFAFFAFALATLGQTGAASKHAIFYCRFTCGLDRRVGL